MRIYSHINICVCVCVRNLDETNYLNFIMELGAAEPKPPQHRAPNGPLGPQLLRMGHALPMVSIGRTMAQRGHQVIFAVSEGGNGVFRVVDSDDGLPLDFHDLKRSTLG